MKIVVTATKSTQPVFEGRLLEEGAHINTIGATSQRCKRSMKKPSGAPKSLWIPQKPVEGTGDLIILLKKGGIQKKDILAELGEVIAGKKPGRGASREITYFKSVGNAVQDVSVAQAIFQRSREKRLGREVELD